MNKYSLVERIMMTRKTFGGSSWESAVSSRPVRAAWIVAIEQVQSTGFRATVRGNEHAARSRIIHQIDRHPL